MFTKHSKLDSGGRTARASFRGANIHATEESRGDSGLKLYQQSQVPSSVALTALCVMEIHSFTVYKGY